MDKYARNPLSALRRTPAWPTLKRSRAETIFVSATRRGTRWFAPRLAVGNNDRAHDSALALRLRLD